MKKIITVFSLAATTAFAMGACNETRQETQQERPVAEKKDVAPAPEVAQQDTIKKSIPSEAEGKIGNTHLKISYHSPGVKGRVVWGGLVPYDQVWVTGAHKATALEIDKSIMIDGKEVPAGKYALFTIPGRENWTIILNRNYEQHLADDYDQGKDVLRVQVKPEIREQHQERLKYGIEAVSESEGAITINWEKILVSLPVKTNS